MQNPDIETTPEAQAVSDWNPFIPMSVEQARAAQKALRAGCPVTHVAPGLSYVFTAKEARQVLLDNKGFSNVGNFGGDPAMPPFVTLLDPPEHNEVRTLLNQGFARTAIVEAGPWIAEIADRLIDGFTAERKADIVSQFSMPLTEDVITRLVGVPPEDSAMLARWSLEITALLPRPRFDGEEWHRIERYIATLLAKRAALSDRPDDMITRLSSATVGGRPLTEREITGHVWLLFVGGLESTAYSLSILVHQLLANREQWKMLLADRSLIANAVEEAIRFTSPLRALERQVTTDAQIGGCPVHKGETLFVGLESANFDTTLFGGDAERFRVDRPDAGRHMAFGFGRHTCLGAALARLEIGTAIGRLLDRLPDLQLAPDFEYETVPSQFSNIPKRVDVIW